MRHFEGTSSRSWARRGQGALPAVIEEDDADFQHSKANPVMFDHWRLLTERFNRVQLSDADVLDISSGSLRPRSGRSTPAMRSASMNRSMPLRPRSQASHRVQPKEWESRKESRQRGRYAKGLRGDKDPEESSEESSEEESEERESGEEDEASMDETLPEKPVKGRKGRREHHRTETTPPQFYMPPPIVYQLPSPYSMYPASMPYYYPPQPYAYPPYSQPQSPVPPAFKPHPNPFTSEKRDSGTQVRVASPPTPKARLTAPSLPRPVSALKVPASKPDSPELAQDDTGPTIPSPIALEIGLSESKSLADIFRERRKDFDQRTVPRKAAKTTYAEKTPAELLALRKEMLKPPSLSSKPSPSPKSSGFALDFESDRKKSEPPSELLDRLAAGSKAKVSRKEMLELTSKNYQSLPEVVRKREEEAKRSEAQQRLTQRKEYEKVSCM